MTTKAMQAKSKATLEQKFNAEVIFNSGSDPKNAGYSVIWWNAAKTKHGRFQVESAEAGVIEARKINSGERKP